MNTHFSLVHIVALALLLYSLALFSSSVRDVAHAEAEVAALRTEYERAQLDNLALIERKDAIESGEGMEALARERLGLVMPNERIFYFIQEN